MVFQQAQWCAQRSHTIWLNNSISQDETYGQATPFWRNGRRYVYNLVAPALVQSSRDVNYLEILGVCLRDVALRLAIAFNGLGPLSVAAIFCADFMGAPAIRV